MERSQYLAAALQQMAEQPGAAQQMGLSPEASAKIAEEAKAWRMANPGKSYFGHMAQQSAQSVAGAPARLMGAAGGGLANLGRMLGRGA